MRKFSKWSLFSLASALCIADLHSFVGLGHYKEDGEIKEIARKDVQCDWMGKNPSYPLPDNTWNITFYGDFLYMRAEQSGLEYAQTSKNRLSDAIVRGRYVDMDFDWKPGYRVGLGFTTPSDNWDVLLNWTYLHSSTSRSVHASEGGTVYAIWSPVVYGSQAQKAEGKWNFNYNVADFELGRAYFVSRALSLRPFLGLRGALLHQHITYVYEGQNFPVPSKTHAENSFNGIGLRGGVNLGWHLDRHWNIQGYASGALLWGRFDIDLKTSQARTTTPIPGAVTDPIKYDYHVNNIVPNLQLGLLLEWGTNFNCNKHRVEVSIGYEFNNWFEQNQLIHTPAPGLFPLISTFSKGDLSLQGATGTIRFYF